MASPIFFNNYYATMQRSYKMGGRCRKRKGSRSPIVPLENKAKRPNFLDFGWTSSTATSSAASSGYCSAENSTESEHPPFDWDSVRIKLEDLGPVDVEIDVPRLQGTICKEYTFNIVAKSQMRASAYEDFKDRLEAFVVGPEPNRNPYKVTMKPGRRLSEIKCSFMPLESGIYKSFVQIPSCRYREPKPKEIKIEKNYDHTTRVIGMDVEVPNPDVPNGKMQSRKPWGICCNTRTEEVIVPDRELHEILVYHPDGTLKGKIGKKGSGEGEFFRPVAAAYSEVHDRIYVADKDNHRIQILSGNGDFIGTFGTKGRFKGQLNFPWGIDVSRDGKLVAVADSRNQRIQIFNHQGVYISHFVGDVSNFTYPRGVCFSLEGDTLYVTDFKMHRVCILDLQYNYCKVIYRNANRPSGIVVDEVGNILVCDCRHSTLLVIPKDRNSPDDRVKHVRSIGNNSVEQPLDVAIMKGGYVALLDLNGRITVF